MSEFLTGAIDAFPDAGNEAETPPAADPGRADWAARFRRGVLGMLPLMIAVIPFGMVFGVSARAEGWSVVQTQGMSLILFAGSAQLAVVSLVSGGAAPLAIVIAVLVMNLRHMLYGMSLARELPAGEPPPRWLLAATLTDESYAVTITEARRGSASSAYLWGASLTLYLCWALATLAGIVLGARIPDPHALGLDLIFPLTFLSLLVMVVRGWRDWVVAAIAAGIAMGLRQVTDGGAALIGGMLLGAFIGAAVVERPRG
ncbi:MAG: AzlC family ABC transporter permease [Thermomicrobiales bacterium]